MLLAIQGFEQFEFPRQGFGTPKEVLNILETEANLIAYHVGIGTILSGRSLTTREGPLDMFFLQKKEPATLVTALVGEGFKYNAIRLMRKGKPLTGRLNQLFGTNPELEDGYKFSLEKALRHDFFRLNPLTYFLSGNVDTREYLVNVFNELLTDPNHYEWHMGDKSFHRLKHLSDSKGREGLIYFAKEQDGLYTCTCQGFVDGHRRCKHINQLKSSLE